MNEIGLMHYILDENNDPVAEPDALKWARWFEVADRTVGRASFHVQGMEIEISTVFLSLPHVSKNLNEQCVMLYETMVFADKAILSQLMRLSETDDRSIIALLTGSIDIQKRYATRQEAERGHATMALFVETCLTAGLLLLEDGATKP